MSRTPPPHVPFCPPKLGIFPVHADACPDDMEEAEAIVEMWGGAVVWHISDPTISGLVICHPAEFKGLCEAIADTNAFKRDGGTLWN